MNRASVAQQADTLSRLPPTQGILQRKCACGNKTAASGECTECAKKKVSLQRKLSIGASNDPLEREADRVADQVMSMSVNSSVATTAPRIQRASTNTDGSGANIPASVNRVLSSPGSPMQSVLRQDMEQRFDHDFSQVRVHTGSAAEQSAKEINANAYTAGQNVVFGKSQYSPETYVGQKLFAHELTHVVQQSGTGGNGVIKSNRNRGLSSDSAVQIPSQTPIIRRSMVPTHFGNFEDFKYQDLTNSAGTKVGVEMYMKFHPGTNVRADLIGMTQAAEGKFNGTQVTQGNYGQHSATSGVGVGSFVDRIEGYPNPIYPTTQTVRAGGSAENLADYQTTGITSLTPAQRTATAAATGVTGVRYQGWGQHGYRKVVAGSYVTQPAELYDAPQLGGAGANSEQVFETTALAIAGSQNGTYYGSVEWGWRKDAAGAFSRLPFRAVSQGVPSATFLTAASIWNPSKASFGFIVTRATNLLDASLTTLSALPLNAELVPTGRQASGGGGTYYEVSHGGNTGFVVSTAVRPAAIGAATVDLPVPMVHTVSNPAGTTMILDATTGTTLAVPVGTRLTVTRCMVSRGILTDHYEGRVVDGPHIGTRGYFLRTDLTLEAVGTH